MLPSHNAEALDASVSYLCCFCLFFPSSAFFVFCSDHRPKIKEDHPGISIGDIAKKLGELWSTQTPKDKAPYEAKAAKLKEKYEKVIASEPGIEPVSGYTILNPKCGFCFAGCGSLQSQRWHGQT